MALAEHKEKITTPLPQRTLCFLIDGDRVLLAYKKRGFGTGKWNGVGGKPEGNEIIPATMVRECQEEIKVRPTSFEQTAIIDFYFLHQPAWNQQVVVFLVSKWHGKPQETEEMKPQWFRRSEIPYDQMWPDDILWLEHALNRKLGRAEFLFDNNEQVVNHKLVLKPDEVKPGQPVTIDGKTYTFPENNVDSFNIWVQIGMPLPFLYLALIDTGGKKVMFHATQIAAALQPTDEK